MGPVSLVEDLCIPHEPSGGTSNPGLNGHLHYPTDIDRILKETDHDKNLQYRADYNNRPSHDISFIPDITTTSGVYTVNLCSFYFYRLIGKLTSFISFLQLQEFNMCNLTVVSSTSSAQRSSHS